jgi:hypothetical protein
VTCASSMANPAPVLGARHGARPTMRSTPVTAPQARQTMRCGLSPARASYVAGLPAARSRSASVISPRLPRALIDSRKREVKKATMLNEAGAGLPRRLMASGHRGRREPPPARAILVR